MTDHQFVTVTRTLVKRAWTDTERKIAVAAATGALGYAALDVLAAYGVRFPATVSDLIPYASAVLGGWAVHSLGAVTTVHTTPAGVTEVSTSTGSIKIPAAVLPQPHVQPAVTPPEPNVPPVADPEPLEVPDVADQPTVAYNGGVPSVTQILADPNARYAQASRFLSSLPSNTAEVDTH